MSEKRSTRQELLEKLDNGERKSRACWIAERTKKKEKVNVDVLRSMQSKRQL